MTRPPHQLICRGARTWAALALLALAGCQSVPLTEHIYLLRGPLRTAEGKKADDQQFHDLAANAGVTFPAGASLAFNPTTSYLIHVNDEANDAKLRDVLLGMDALLENVEVEASLVESTNTVAKTNAAPDHVLSTIRVSGQSGAMLQARSTVNLIGAKRAALAPESVRVEAGADTNQLAMALDLGTNEVGSVINVTPTIAPDHHSIMLTVIWQAHWCPATEHPQQHLHATEIWTSLTVEDQKPLRMPLTEQKQIRLPAGTAAPAANPKFLVLTATITDPLGRPYRSPAPKPKPGGLFEGQTFFDIPLQ